MDTLSLLDVNHSHHDNTDLAMRATTTIHPPARLENLPLECIQVILEHLSDDCHALYSLLIMNRAWFQMVIPFLYRSPMVLIDATWPKLSPYSQVLKKELPTPVDSLATKATNALGTLEADSSESITTGQQQQQRNGRSTVPSDAGGRRSSTASLTGPGGGVGYSPRTPSRSSSRSSTRSMDAFHHGRNEAVHQKDQRERLVKRKKMQVLWVLLNCTLSEEERTELEQARTELAEKERAERSLAPSPSPTATSNEGGTSQSIDEEHTQTTRKPSRCRVVPIQHSTSTLLSLELSRDLDIDVDYFQPMVDYLSYHTHYYHPGLRFTIWKLFPNIDDSFTIEWRLISHCPARIRELFLETVQMQDLMPLVSKLETLHRIRTCHEDWDVQGSVNFIQKHNELFGTVRMLELEAYLPENHDTIMEPDLSELIARIDHLTVLELAGFTHLQADLEPIPRGNLKVLRLNCGSLNPNLHDIPVGAVQYQHQPQLGQQEQQGQPQSAGDIEGTAGSTRMNISTFLSQCRQLEELHLKSVDENLLEWAVLERRNFEAGTWTVPSSHSAHHVPTPSLVPLRVIELSGTDSEHIAMTISHAAMAFQDTLEVIKANSYSYQSNRSLTSLSWSSAMPRLRVLKIVGRANLPFDFRSLQHCPALRILDLSKYSGMRACSESLLLNLKYLTHLEYLGLSSFDHLTDATLRTILGCMPGLKHLRLAIGDTPIPTSSYAVSGVAPNRGTGSSPAGSNSHGAGEGTQRPPPSMAQHPLASMVNGSASTTTAAYPEPPLPPGMTHMVVGHIQTQQPTYQGHAHPHYAYHAPSVSPLVASTAAVPFESGSGSGSGIATGAVPSMNLQGVRPSFSPGTLDLQDFIPQSSRASVRSSSVSSVSSVSTSTIPSSSLPLSLPPPSLTQTYPLPMMDRFYLENNYLSLDGILDAIDGFSDTKNQLEKLSIVLGKLDFEEHYYRLEKYNQLHPGLEITVYRYAHAV
ncbi:hypothetical protein EMPS_05433 [Entomortierella parvispora]|uniref:F-box domain-containing protein n=1 Tax=Entomortierella parvispora TaxID=205924 RepID=A0A9P3LWR0_9FUNG|nr:hypothetical protein EMPS_05433 [Entomortierella parvispora]